MQRINVVGTSASGKSTFARQLAQQLGLAYIELDDLFWLDDWQQSQDQDFFRKIQYAIDQAPHGYVIDGNYTRTIPIKWASIDTVIWIDLPFHLNVYRAIKRALQRTITRQRLWPGSNNHEHWRSLFTRDSIVWWMIKTYRKNRRHYTQLMHDPRYTHIHWVHLTTPHAIRQFLTNLSSVL